MRDRNRQRWYRIAAGASALVALAILVGTLTPPEEMPQDVPGSDKLHHFMGFAALAFPMVAYRPRSALWVVPAAAAFGVIIELLQPYFGRHRDVGDMIANTTGAMAGAALGTLCHHAFLRCRARPRG